MKLSDAIRLGAMMRPQAFGSLSNSAGTCAFGAALDAAGVPFRTMLAQTVSNEAGRLFPALMYLGTHPITGELRNVPSVIFSLNDRYHWTREQIADWVELTEASSHGQGRDSATETSEGQCVQGVENAIQGDQGVREARERQSAEARQEVSLAAL